MHLRVVIKLKLEAAEVKFLSVDQITKGNGCRVPVGPYHRKNDEN